MINIPPNNLRVFSTNQERTAYNDEQFELTEGETHFYQAIDNSSDICSSLAAEETCLVNQLRLKFGVPVMLLYNISIPNGWINGTLAVVTALYAKAVEISKLTYARKIDLILRYDDTENIELCSNEWKKTKVTTQLKLKQQSKNLRVNACIINCLNGKYCKVHEILALDLIGKL